MNMAQLISAQLSLPQPRVKIVLELLQEGATIPFLARYRKEQTGGMDEDQLRAIQSLQETLDKLESRRATIVKSLQEQSLYEGDLKTKIDRAATLVELEDLYLPYKPKRKTRATTAKENGLEPLAQLLLRQPRNESPQQAAKRFVKGTVATVEDALAGARDIVAELSAENPTIRKVVREKAQKFGRVKAVKKKGADDPKEVFRSYYEFQAPVNRLQPHQILALDRGENDKVLKVSFELQERDWQEPLRREYRPFAQSPWGQELQAALEDGAKRLLLPAMERDVRKSLTEEAQSHAIGVFGENLESLLLVPPLADHTVLALDPGFRSGCKIAVVDPTGRLLATDTIYPHPPQKQEKRSLETLENLIKRFKVTVIAIGNGTASRETEQLVAQLSTPYLIVSEAGASVYSASPLAKAEFPELDVSIRGAVSIGRRVQDPLAELIKIDPKSVGVGMYQHDLDQTKLSHALSGVVESVVHRVGVELNTASAPLLSHIGGIGPKTAERIVDYRDNNGPFPDRATLKKVKGLGPKAFELAAGFIRVRGGKNPLDDTSIHPESYPVAKTILKLTKGDLKNASLNQLKDSVDCPEPTLKDIIEQLQKPGRDPREDLPKPVLRSGVLSMNDLYPGLTLTGTVRNVIDFGSFVDIGVKQDGLIHVSKLRGKKLAVGQVIEVEVLEVDERRGRISLALA
jgi:protein Tex